MMQRAGQIVARAELAALRGRPVESLRTARRGARACGRCKGAEGWPQHCEYSEYPVQGGGGVQIGEAGHAASQRGGAGEQRDGLAGGRSGS